MFPSACSVIVCWFSMSFTTCFGLHGHLHVRMILYIFTSIRLCILLRCIFPRGHTLHVFNLWDGREAMQLGAAKLHADWLDGRTLGECHLGQSCFVGGSHISPPRRMLGSLRRGAVLKLGHSFLQWSGSLRGHPVTEEGDL
jgi:hypothetical protein